MKVTGRHVDPRAILLLSKSAPRTATHPFVRAEILRRTFAVNWEISYRSGAQGWLSAAIGRQSWAPGPGGAESVLPVKNLSLGGS